MGEAEWDKREHEARERYRLQSGVKRKNPMLVSATAESLLKDGIQVLLIEEAISTLMKFASCKQSTIRV